MGMATAGAVKFGAEMLANAKMLADELDASFMPQ